MKVNNQLISNLEKLARLQLNPEERSQLSADLGRILDMVAQLQTLDTQGIEPLLYLYEQANVTRDDQPGITMAVTNALQNAPQQEGPYFKVPKVIEP